MSTVPRRLVSIAGLVGAAVLLLVLVPIWIPAAVVIDLVRLRRRLPSLRLLLFALGWTWLESAGVVLAFGLWVVGQRNNRDVHYRLQAWWAANVLGLLRATTGIRVITEGVDQLAPGPAVMLCRHACLADLLVSEWVVTSLAGLRPRYVLERELLADPCLDIVGHRLPNLFLDRQATESRGDLDALTRLSTGMGRGDIAVIFPEGTRASPGKRERALQKLSETNPDRAARLGGLRHLLPPRPAGSAALIAGAPDADVVIGWHIGFDGLDTIGGILRHLACTTGSSIPRVRRIPRAEVPTGEAFTAWLDSIWLQADNDVNEMLEAGQT